MALMAYSASSRVLNSMKRYLVNRELIRSLGMRKRAYPLLFPVASSHGTVILFAEIVEPLFENSLEIFVRSFSRLEVSMMGTPSKTTRLSKLSSATTLNLIERFSQLVNEGCKGRSVTHFASRSEKSMVSSITSVGIVMSADPILFF